MAVNNISNNALLNHDIISNRNIDFVWLAEIMIVKRVDAQILINTKN